jgi:hypothetical protein
MRTLHLPIPGSMPWFELLGFTAVILAGMFG